MPKLERDLAVLLALPAYRLGLPGLLQHSDDGSQLGLRRKRSMLPLPPDIMGCSAC